MIWEIKLLVLTRTEVNRCDRVIIRRACIKICSLVVPNFISRIFTRWCDLFRVCWPWNGQYQTIMSLPFNKFTVSCQRLYSNWVSLTISHLENKMKICKKMKKTSRETFKEFGDQRAQTIKLSFWITVDLKNQDEMKILESQINLPKHSSSRKNLQYSIFTSSQQAWSIWTPSTRSYRCIMSRNWSLNSSSFV